jgi:hypothetical protein
MMGMALADVPSNHYDIVCTATVAIDPRTNTKVILIIHQAIYMTGDQQYESLLHCDQAHDQHVIINDMATCYFDSYNNPGKKNMEVEGQSVNLRYGRLKCFLNIRTPTPHDWDYCPVWELTSPTPWIGKNRFR